MDISMYMYLLVPSGKECVRKEVAVIWLGTWWSDCLFLYPSSLPPEYLMLLLPTY